MLADFYIPKLSSDMKIAVQKNQLVGQILYRSLVSFKKPRHYEYKFPLRAWRESLGVKNDMFLSSYYHKEDNLE